MSKFEDLSSSVDEVWMQLAELLEHVEAIEQQLRKRDAMNLLMVRHVERLVREKDQLARELDEARKSLESLSANRRVSLFDWTSGASNSLI